MTAIGLGAAWRVCAPLLLALMAPAAAPVGTPPRAHTVEIRAMAFHPAALTIARGDTVVWVNRDIVPHTATAPATSGEPLDTGELRTGEVGRFVGRGPGAIRYVCTLHPFMQATLLVK